MMRKGGACAVVAINSRLVAGATSGGAGDAWVLISQVTASRDAYGYLPQADALQFLLRSAWLATAGWMDGLHRIR
jgi:hypothetical protein